MAFNPFEAFSIRSKLGRSVMAIIGIVVMLTFVLSSGAVGTRNDFFDQIGGMFNSKKRGEVVAVAYGDDVHETDLTELRRQRRAANTYLNRALDRAYANWAEDLKRELDGTRLSPETKREIDKFVNLRQNSEKNQRPYVMYLLQFLDIQSLFTSPDARTLTEAMTKARLKTDSEDKRALETLVAIMMYDQERYFSGRPPILLVELGDSDRDALDFYLLLKKADQLGINYSHEGIVELISHDTLGRLGQDLKDALPIERQLRDSERMGDFSHDWLINAVGNEYRVRDTLAALQGIPRATADARALRDRNPLARFLLGGDTGNTTIPGALATASALPGAVTPYEFFEYYKDRCSEHSFDLLELSTESFLGQVTAEPNPKEKVELFNKYRGELPDPSKDRPGFKEPRKVKVEYVSLDATAPRITQAIPKIRAASQFLCISAGAIEGNPITALAQAAQPAMAETLPVKEAVADKMDENLSAYKAIEQYLFMPRDVSVYRPESIVGMLGGFGGFPSMGGAAAAVALPYRYIEQHDLKMRVPFLLQSWLTPFNPTMANALGMPAFAYALNPKLPPAGLYLKEATESVRKRQRQALFQSDVGELRSKLFKIQMESGRFTDRQPDKAKLDKARAESQKLVMEWLKDRGLTPSGNKQPEDQFVIVNDPELKALNDLATKEPDGSNSLVNRLFTVDPRTGQPRSDIQPFEPFWFPADPSGEGLDKPNHLVWVAEEVEPKAYNSLENADRITNSDMSKRVVRAWKLEKARVLAKAEADRIAEQVRNIAKDVARDPIGVEKRLKDLAAEKKLRNIELDGLALLKFQHEPGRAAMGYEPPKVEKTQVTYPTPNFAEQLLELRKQPVGGVTVLADVPRTHYYIACEVSRQEKTIDQFRDVFAKTNATGITQNPLYEQHALSEERGRAFKEVLERLRADAKLEEKEAFKNREKKDAE